jgi:hypothetical protein
MDVNHNQHLRLHPPHVAAHGEHYTQAVMFRLIVARSEEDETYKSVYTRIYVLPLTLTSTTNCIFTDTKQEIVRTSGKDNRHHGQILPKLVMMNS